MDSSSVATLSLLVAWRRIANAKSAARDARPVVDNFDEIEAASFDVDGDASRPRVDGILDQLFDDRRGAFDDLSGGNLTDRYRIELANGSHAG